MVTNISKSSAAFEAKVREYDALREQAKTIKNRMDVLAAELKDIAEKHGVKNDSGSFYVESSEFIFGKQAKKTVSFDTDTAVEFFTRRGFHDCVKTVKVINEGAVESRVSNGDISYSDLESITKTKVSYAIDVKRKEAMPEVEQSSVTVAASRKPKKPTFRKKGD